MSNKDKLVHIDVYRKKKKLSIKNVILFLIILYLLATTLTYLLDKRVVAYEVRDGSILRDMAFTGVAIRTEQLVNASEKGYINHLVPNGAKVGRKTPVYTQSEEKLNLNISAQPTDENGTPVPVEMTAEEKNSILTQVQSFNDSYQDKDYQDTYLLKDTVINTLHSNSSAEKQQVLQSLLQDPNSHINVYNAEDDGIIVFSTDGYESLTVEEITEDTFEKNDYQVQDITNDHIVEKNKPVYKLITEEKWNIAIQLSDQQVEEFADKETVKIRFLDDNETTWAYFEIQKNKDLNLGIITLNKSMVRYADHRFVDIEIIMEDQSGLKIPVSSVVEKDFYVVPSDYITLGGNNKSSGVLIEGDNNSTIFQNVTIYYHDAENDLVYLDPNAFSKNSVLRKPDSDETYPLEKTEKLKGVYNINKGYAIFKQIDILCKSDDYYIVAEGSDFGLSNFDHIALDGKIVKENDIVF